MIQRIILTSNYSPWSSYSGGGQRSTHNIAVHLSKLRYDVHVIYTKTFFENYEPPKDLKYTIHWANFYGFKSKKNNVFRMFSGISVTNILKKLIIKNTIVHSNGDEGAFISKLKKQRHFKFIITPRYASFPISISTIAPCFAGALLHWNSSKYVLLHKAMIESDLICPTSRFS